MTGGRRQRQIDRIATECVASRWRSASRVITSVYDDALQPLGVKVSQFNVLVAIAKMGVARSREIGAHLRLEASTISRNLDRMRKSGWIVVERDENDARAQPFRLTPAGWKLVERGYPLWSEAQEKAEKLIGREGLGLLKKIQTRGLI